MLICNKNYSNKIDEELTKRFKDIFKFSNYDVNQFISLIRKGTFSSLSLCVYRWLEKI